MSISIDRTELFHVHTWRCRHAEEIPDKAYVKKAMELGATGILFADHSPFPGNPFGNRMDIEELPEYLNTLQELKKKYEGEIYIRIGLEIEYLPSFRGFYEELRANPLIDFMMLGQHMHEVSSGTWSFQLTSTEKNEREHIGNGEAIIQGIQSGLFDIVAHPDRIFKRCKEWDDDMERLGIRIIDAAFLNHVMLEKNLESMKRKRNYREQFWKFVPEEKDIVIGTDAHSIEELVEKWDIQQLYYAGSNEVIGNDTP